MVAARGARRPRRGRRLAAVRARPRGVRVARSARPRTSPRSRTAASRSSPPRSSEYAAPALALARAHALRARRRRRRRRSRGAVALPRGRRARAARSSSSRDEVLDAAARRHRRPSRSRSSSRRVERWRAPLETAFATAGIPYAIDGRVRLAGDAARPRAALAAALRLGRRRPRASSTRSCARRTRASRARASTSPRAGCAAARSSAPERVEAETERLREAPLVPLRDLRDAASPVAGVRALLADDGSRRVRPRRRRRSATRRGSTCAASPRPRGCSTSSTRWERARRAARRRPT